MANGTMASPTRDAETSTLADDVRRIATSATAHHPDQSLLGVIADEDGSLWLHMASWARAGEAVRALAGSGYTAKHAADGCVRVSNPGQQS